MYFVFCVIYIVFCILYLKLCVLYFIFCSLYFILCIFFVIWILDSVPCILYFVFCNYNLYVTARWNWLYDAMSNKEGLTGEWINVFMCTSLHQGTSVLQEYWGITLLHPTWRSFEQGGTQLNILEQRSWCLSLSWSK